MRKTLLALVLFAFALCLNAPAPVDASLAVTQLHGFNKKMATAGPLTLTFNACANDGSNLSSYSFASLSTGTAASDRYVLIGVAGKDNATNFSWTSLTIDGNSATELIDSANTSSTVQAGFYILAVPTGTSSTIVVTPSEALTSASVCSWSITGLGSTTPITTNNAFSNTAAAMTLDLNGLNAGDLMVVMAAEEDLAGAPTVSGVTSRGNATMGGAAEGTRTAFDGTASAGSNAISVDYSASNDSIGVSVALR